MARKPATKPATKGATKPATKGATKPATVDTNAKPPAGGYVLLVAQPKLSGSRAARWPLLEAHAGQPGGVAALAQAMKAAGYAQTVSGTLGNWCAKAGLAWVDGKPKPAAKGAKAG